MKENNYEALFKELQNYIPSERLFTDELRTLAYGTDASFYRMVPQIVVRVKNEDEARTVISLCRKHNTPVTFRSAGTSLSGQAITNSVLMVVDRSWSGHEINEDASVISMQPALIGGYANLYLNKYNKKIGPDPASINAAMISGIVVNNASGMTSGVAKNTYNTLHGFRIIFADGSVLDTTDDESKRRFAESHPELIEQILKLSAEVKSNEEIASRISYKYRIKNTTGYSVNALVDFDDPFDIIAHLMVGSEGTLGFISEIKLKTVPNPPAKASALIYFPDIHEACKAIPVLRELPINAAEIMDRQALKSVENKEGMPDFIKTLPTEAAALLVETSADTPEDLKINTEKIIAGLGELKKLKEIEFTDVPSEYKKLWDVRKGLFPSVCKDRSAGTTVIIEDVNFPTERLAEAATDLQKMFAKYNFENTIIWGHALAGNLHFVFALDFEKEEDVARYKKFMNELTRLVIEKYDGSLKAEHGTGRNMAPFVKYEWGSEIYEIMKKIKRIFDPQNIFNPGVLINEDENIHVKNLKHTPKAHPIIDKCIECGFCENICPSKDLTLTPRQRITVYREIKLLEKSGENPELLKSLREDYDYQGIQTCATDGLCELKCPVGIDTGNFIKELRKEYAKEEAKQFANLVADYFSLITSFGKIGLNFLHFVRGIFGEDFLSKTSELLRGLTDGKFPLWNSEMPKANSARFISSYSHGDEKAVVYFPSCINRTMGASPKSKEKKTVTDVMEKLLKKAGYKIIYPERLEHLCCGMPFASKGLKKQAEKKSNELYAALWKASEKGKFPVVYDMSPCAKTSKENFAAKDGGKLKVYDSVEFAHDFLLKELEVKKLNEKISLFPVCSVVKMGIEEKLLNIARACAEEVITPQESFCCGFAGDRGFTYPELNASALKTVKSFTPDDVAGAYSSSRTCEIGLSLHSGVEYKSILFLFDKATD